MTRQEANKQIVVELMNLVYLHPDLRFYQLMRAADIVRKEDDFYTESTETLQRLLKSVLMNPTYEQD